MKIELLVHRPGGTVVAMPDGTEYEFRPDADGRHVAEVGNDEHARVLLGIPEGYRRLDDGPVAPEEVPKPRRGRARART